jgi:plastocyanin
MKKHLSIVILIMLISLSCAVSEKKFDSQVGYNFGDLKLSGVDDPSGSVTKVDIKDNSFKPSTLTVPPGATVEWHNQDVVQHSVTSDIQGLFDSGALNPGKRFTSKFDTPGSYSYHCNIHPEMRGTIIVKNTQFVQDPTSSGSESPGSTEAGSASWSEKPLSSTELVKSANLQSATQSATVNGNQRLLVNPAITQSAALSSAQTSGQDSSPASSQVALQKFSKYYRSTSQAPEDQLTAPSKIDLKEVEPAMLYFGSTQKAVSYDQYQTYALSTGINSLWISGTGSWSQYAMVPLGSMLSMITTSSLGGYGYLYEIYPDGNLDMNSYYFYPYNQIGFYADKVGQHQLFFNIAGQPSNVIVIDVVLNQPPAESAYDFAAVSISSAWLRGYNVYVDGSYQATEGMTGDPEGTVTINVPGNSYHNIAIDGSGFTFSDYKYFQAAYAYQLNV